MSIKKNKYQSMIALSKQVWKFFKTLPTLTIKMPINSKSSKLSIKTTYNINLGFTLVFSDNSS